ncbi:Glyoxalase I [Gossypium australe]|uniref:Glyoxalase I n=1 Tax=Gossypium australe TaxID=47621 RepID=A0A5B6W8S4_9ROSI|nr:Glyoxalase I [Gossypium australe]
MRLVQTIGNCNGVKIGPEDMRYKKPVSVCNETTSDLAGEIVAALSAASIIRFTAITYTTIDACGGEARKLYGSSGYKDELVRATTWLFFATGNRAFSTMPPQTLLQQLTMKQRLTKGSSIVLKKTWFTEPSKAGNAGLVAALIAHHDPPTRSSASNGPNLGLDIVGIFEKVHLDS